MSDPMLTESERAPRAPLFRVFRGQDYLTYFTSRDRAQEYVTYAAIAQRHSESEYEIREN